MTSEDIRKLLALGEGQRIEFKSTCGPVAALGKVVCGMLNTSGGYIVCGVTDDHVVSGVSLKEGQLATLERQLHDGLSPKALVSVEELQLQQKTVVVIEVPAGQDVPYAFQDVFYIREGDRDQRADAETIRDMVMRRQIAPERWERRLSVANLETDLDTDEVFRAVRDAQRGDRAWFRDAGNAEMVLEDFSAAKYGRLTNGGDVLFSLNSARRLPQTRLRAYSYNSDKAGDKFADMTSFEGPAMTLFEQAYSFIVRNTRTISRFIKGNPVRQDSPLYPEAAVREALINAFAHRDYSSASGGIAIHVFPRRLEIWNSGSLPPGVTAETLGRGQLSVLRNPDIAHVLYLRGLMEKAGRGSVLMVQACENNGLSAPKWQSDENLGVTLTFFAPEVTPEATGEVTPEVAPEVTPEVLKMLGVMKGAMNRAEIMAALGLKDEKHFREHYQQAAIAVGLIEMTIPDKPRSSNQQYRLTALGKAVLSKEQS